MADSENLLVYAIRTSNYAKRAFDDALLYVVDTSGKDGTDADTYGVAFQDGLYAAIGTLATLPTRYPVADEADKLNPPPVRVMPYRQRPGSPAWRVLYRVYEADENDAGRVKIVALRHGAQRPMTREEGRDIAPQTGSQRKQSNGAEAHFVSRK